MSPAVQAEVEQITVRLLDDAYLAWLSAESEAEHALGDWFRATGGQRSPAYFAYRAALEREHAAAADLERLCELAGAAGKDVGRPEQA